MKLKTVILAIMAIYLAIASNALYARQGGGDILVLNLVGIGEMYEDEVPDIDGDGVDDDAICFDVELFNAEDGRVIGTATDCLSQIENGDNGGLALVGTTYFYMHHGMLITRGRTTVQPTNHSTTTPSGQMITHITGASGTSNAILYGTDRFADSTGTVRLSGMVDMTYFEGNVGDPIAFDCLFVINLD